MIRKDDDSITISVRKYEIESFENLIYFKIIMEKNPCSVILANLNIKNFFIVQLNHLKNC